MSTELKRFVKSPNANLMFEADTNSSIVILILIFLLLPQQEKRQRPANTANLQNLRRSTKVTKTGQIPPEVFAHMLTHMDAPC